MGLDVTAYRNAERVEPQPESDEEVDKLYDTANVFTVHNDKGFAARADGAQGGFYRGEPVSHDASFGEYGGFRAGSYGGYNQFREQLCQAALEVSPEAVWDDLDAYAGQPFFELVNFTDCDGAIGPTTCAKLARDFADGEETVRPELEEWAQNTYRRFREAFEAAAGNGFVIYH